MSGGAAMALRCVRLCLNGPLDLLGLDADLRDQPVEPLRHPPVPTPGELHERWHKHKTDDRGVQQDGDSEPDPELLDHALVAEREGAEDGDHDRGGGPKTATMIAAAAVITRLVTERPRATASELSPDFRYSSRMRLTRKTS